MALLEVIIGRSATVAGWRRRAGKEADAEANRTTRWVSTSPSRTVSSCKYL